MSLKLSLSKLADAPGTVLTSPRASGIQATTLTSPRVNASQNAPFHESALRRDYSRDITFGTTRSNVREVALKEQSAADFNLLRYSSNEGSGSARLPDVRDARVKAGIDAYHAQFSKLFGHAPTRMQRASEDFRFLSLRGNLIQPKKQYVATFMESLMRQVLAPRDDGPPGKVNYTLDQFDFYQHFSARAMVEADRQKAQPGYAFVNYLEDHTMGSRGGPGSDGMHHATISSVELGALLEGRYSGSFAQGGKFAGAYPDVKNPRTGMPYEQVPVRFFDASGERLDDDTVRELYGRAAQACSDPSNMEHLARTGGFSPEAKEAVDALQAYVHGSAAMLAPAEKWDVNLGSRQEARSQFGFEPEPPWAPGQAE